MEVINFRLNDETKEKIEKKISSIISKFHDKSDALEAAQNPMTTLWIPKELTDYLKQEIPEIVNVICKNPRQIVHIENAPLAAPFGQGHDKQFINQVRENRLPIAEYF